MAPVIIHCAAGNARFAEIAIRHGLEYGAQLPATIYYPPYFVDQNWKKPDRTKYMQALKEHRPALATVLDLEHECQLDEVMSWADEAAQYVETVIIIPKVMGIVPRIPDMIQGKPVRLGYSVPTSFGGTSLPLWEFGNRAVHLLGGSPHRQYELSKLMNVVSADGNYAIGQALRHKQYFANGAATYALNRFFPRLDMSPVGHVESDGHYLAYELSVMNMKSMWIGCTAEVRFAVEADLPRIKAIANQYKNELGFVMLPTLRKAIEKRELTVACYGGRVVGFVNWHKRKDGIITIYEIAVDPTRKGEGLARGLLASLPRATIRLKCTVDNPANEFYEHMGFTCLGTEDGRKRALNVWQKVASNE